MGGGCCNSVILLTLIINCYVAGPAHGQRTKARRHYGMPPDHGVLASEQRKRAKGFVLVSLICDFFWKIKLACEYIDKTISHRIASL